jgi:hypothetical protein
MPKSGLASENSSKKIPTYEKSKSNHSQGRQGKSAKPTTSSFHHHLSPISTTATKTVYMLSKDIIARASYMPINTPSKRYNGQANDMKQCWEKMFM